MKGKVSFLLVLFLMTGCSTLTPNQKKQFVFDEPIKALKMTVDYDPAFFPSNNVCGKVTVQNYGTVDYKRVTMMFSFTDSFGTILATNTFCLANGLASGSTATIEPNLSNPLCRTWGFGGKTFRSCPASMNCGRVEINTEVAVKKEVVATSAVPEVEPKQPEKVYEVEARLISMKLDGYNVFDDGKIRIAFSIDKIDPKLISFVLENKTDKAVVIDWNKVSYIDQFRSAHCVIHNGIKYSQRNEKMRDTVVPPKSKLDDLVLPADNMIYSSYLGWHAPALFYGELIARYPQTQVSIYMPLLIGDEKKDYTFTFNVRAMLRQ